MLKRFYPALHKHAYAYGLVCFGFVWFLYVPWRWWLWWCRVPAAAIPTTSSPLVLISLFCRACRSFGWLTGWLVGSLTQRQNIYTSPTRPHNVSDRKTGKMVIRKMKIQRKKERRKQKGKHKGEQDMVLGWQRCIFALLHVLQIYFILLFLCLVMLLVFPFNPSSTQCTAPTQPNISEVSVGTRPTWLVIQLLLNWLLPSGPPTHPTIWIWIEWKSRRRVLPRWSWIF